MVNKVKLFKVLIDFIKFYYGIIWVEYFYRKYLVVNFEYNFDEMFFVYLGLLFKFKEEMILMMVDSVEVVCKSLKNFIEEEFFKLIDKVIEGKIIRG